MGKIYEKHIYALAFTGIEHAIIVLWVKAQAEQMVGVGGYIIDVCLLHRFYKT